MKIEVKYTKKNATVDAIIALATSALEELELSADIAQIEDAALEGGIAVAVDDYPLPVQADGDAYPKWLIEAGILRALKPKGLLVLCVANSARSQIGEGIARMLAPADVRVQSAGSDPTSPRPEAIAVLAEVGVDASGHTSKNVADIDPKTVDTVITLCDAESCPVFLGKAYRLHWGLPDPGGDDEESRMAAFRSVRKELIKRFKVVFG